MMFGYTARDVATMLELPVGEVRSWVKAGLLEPARGSRGEYRFSFQDLVLLRTAKGLFAANVSAPRVRRALKRLRARLPDGQPLTGVKITAESNRIVVRDGNSAYEPESGQVLLDFAVAELAREVAPLERKVAAPAQADLQSASEWFDIGCAAESSNIKEAERAYMRALALDPKHVDAHVNLGRLHQESGRLAEAEAHYRKALELDDQDVTAAFNLGVALEDLGRLEDGVDAYAKALAADPRCADAHYNLARLYEKLGQSAAAIRHLNAYRRLIRG
jgi:tetratricopeptide (TPR) repeat protein